MKKSSDPKKFNGKFLLLKSCRSTQDIIERVRSNWFLVQSDRQSSGRGRKDRNWDSPPGGLYFSTCFPLDVAEVPDPLYLLSAASLWIDVLEERLPSLAGDFSLKWPNDLLLYEKKLGGFLGEKTPNRLLLGVGINVNNELPSKDYRLPATSLKEVVKHPLPRIDLLFNWYRLFRQVLDQGSDSQHFSLAALESRIVTLGKTIDLKESQGEAVGLTCDGGLRVDTGDTETVLRSDDNFQVIKDEPSR